LVVVPIKAYPAVSTTEDISFHQLHADCGQRIRYQRHCPVHGQVASEAIVRGHEYAPGQYVVVEPSELDQIRPPKDKGLVLEQVVAPELIDPVLFAGRSLFLAPDGRPARRPYRILTDALALRRTWALGRITMGGHRHTVVVRPNSRLLSMHILHKPSKLRTALDLEADLTDEAGSEEEQQLARTLIDAATGPVDWARYGDDTAERLSTLVEAKVQHRQVVVAADEEPVQTLRLLDALKQSVAEATDSSRSSRPTHRKRRFLFGRSSA
jgi:DNA end-binding protein Ku